MRQSKFLCSATQVISVFELEWSLSGSSKGGWTLGSAAGAPLGNHSQAVIIDLFGSG